MPQQQTNPDYAAAVEKLVAALVELPVNGTIEYSALERIAGAGIQLMTTHRFLLNRARERVEKERGCFLECTRGVGLTKLPSERAPDVGSHGLQKITRSARRTEKRLTRLQGNLSSEAQKRVIAQVAALGAIRTIAHPKRIAAVAAGIDIAKPTPPKNALRLFQPGR